jgi:hypothetical protein
LICTFFYGIKDGNLTFRSGDFEQVLESKVSTAEGVISSSKNNITQLQVFTRGADNALRYISWNGIKWGNWNAVAGLPISSSPSAVVLNNNTIDIFARGPDNALWYVSSKDGIKWGNWNYLGGGLYSAPITIAAAVVSSKNNNNNNNVSQLPMQVHVVMIQC